MKKDIYSALPERVRRRYELERLYGELFRGNMAAAGLKSGEKSLYLPSAISGELARAVCRDFDSALFGKEDCYGKYMSGNLRRFSELTAAFGYLALRITKGRIIPFTADRVLPYEFFPDGRIKKTGLLYFARSEDSVFCREECFEVTPDGVKVGNYLYSVKDYGMFSPVCALTAFSPATLDECDAWGELSAETLYEGESEIPVFFLNTPLQNTAEPDFPLGESSFARAVPLILEADRQFSRLLWEYEGGELAVDISEDLVRRTKRGYELPVGKERLFRPNLLDGDCPEPIKVFAPALRDASYIRGLDIILSRVEDSCGLSRGTLSSLNYSSRTATEIADSQTRYERTAEDYRKALERDIKSALEWARKNKISY